MSTNLYMDAVNLCTTFHLPKSLVSVVGGLPSKCIKLSNSRGTEVAAAWTWLAENRPGGKEVQGEDAVETSWPAAGAPSHPGCWLGTRGGTVQS